MNKEPIMKSTTSHEDQYAPEPTPAEEEAWREIEKRQSAPVAAQAQPSRNAGELPPLPEPGMTNFNYDGAQRWYTATQMREYALAPQASGQHRRVQTITMFGSDEITLRRGSGWDEHRVVWNVAAREAAKEQS